MPVMTLMIPTNFEIGFQTTWHPSLAATHELAVLVLGAFTATGSWRPAAASIATSAPMCRRPFEREDQRPIAG